MRARQYQPLRIPPARATSAESAPAPARETVGLEVFVESTLPAARLGDLRSQPARSAGFKLKMISNRGTQVYPTRGAETDCVDHWRCRFLHALPAEDLALAAVHQLLGALQNAGLRWMHLEKLQVFDGSKPGFTKAQGED